jgi:hypothetical protein
VNQTSRKSIYLWRFLLLHTTKETMKDIIVQTIRSIAQKVYRRYNQSTKNTFQEQHHTPPPPKESTQNFDPPLEKPIEETKTSITVDVVETPNPHACKYDVSIKVSHESFSFSQKDSPIEHPLANALLSIEGISSVFGVHTFVTATKIPNAKWEEIHPQVIDILHKHLI